MPKISDRYYYFSSKSLGKIQFYPIGFADSYVFLKIKKETGNVKQCLQKYIYEKLVDDIDFADFEKIDDAEFADLTIGYFSKVRELKKSVELIKESNYTGFVNALDKYFKGLSWSLDGLIKIVDEHQKAIQRIVSRISDVGRMYEFLRLSFPTIDYSFVQTEMNKFEAILNSLVAKLSYSLQFPDFSILKKAHKDSLKKLKKYSWFVNSTMPAKFLVSMAETKNAKEASQLFVEYHIVNDCSVLQEYLDKWRGNSIFKKRNKILRDVVLSVRDKINDSEINIANVVVPVLINQIEGIRQDIIGGLGFEHIGKNQFKDPITNQCISWTKIYRETWNNADDVDDFTKQALEIYIEVLFQQSDKPATIINFSRHRISHGIATRYGRLDTLIRCIMMIDYLDDISRDI